MFFALKRPPWTPWEQSSERQRISRRGRALPIGPPESESALGMRPTASVRSNRRRQTRIVRATQCM